MSHDNNSYKFNGVMEAFAKIDFMSGLFLFKGTQKWTCKEKLTRMNIYVFFVYAVFMTYGTFCNYSNSNSDMKPKQIIISDNKKVALYSNKNLLDFHTT